MSNVDYLITLDEPNESFSFKSNKIQDKAKIYEYEFENMKLKLKELEKRVLALELKQEIESPPKKFK